MFKRKNVIFIMSLIIFMIFTQIIQPIALMASSFGLTNENNYQLYKMNESIVVEGLIIKEDTYLYGTPEGEDVSVQYSDTNTTISLDLLEEVDKNEKNFIKFHELDNQYVIKNLVKDTAFYSIEPDDKERIILTEDVAYPVYENDLGLEVVYVGNTEYYLSEEDRITALESYEDKDGNREFNEAKDNNKKNIKAEFSSDEEINKDIIDVIPNNVPNKSHFSQDRYIEESKDNDKNEKDEKSEQEQDGSISWKDVKYFKVTTDNLVVNERKNGKLEPVGKLKKDQVYPRVRDYGNWHEITIGNTKGYVWKADTIPANKDDINNENKDYKNQSLIFTTLQDVTIYDNSSGELTPFGVIDKGQSYPIASDYGNWWRIIFSDRIGYVKKSEVALSFTNSDKYFKTLTNLPIYDNRTGKLVKVGELPRGQVYPRVSDYGNWHRIKFGDIYGYVRKADTIPANGTEIRNVNSNYKNLPRTFTPLKNVIVYDNTSGNLVPFGTIDKDVSYPIVGDYGNWWRIILSDRIGYVSKKDVKTDFIVSDKYFRAETNLPIYDNRTGKLVKIGEIQKGQVYPRVSDYGNWHRIQFGEIYGYVNKSETTPANGNEIKNMNNTYKFQSRTIIPKNNVIVYDNTSGKLVPFGTIEKGIEYPLVSDYGNWWRIVYADRVGYVSKSDVNLGFIASDKYFRAETNLPIYDNRSGKLEKVGEVLQGQVYPRVSDYGNWHRIQFGKIYGYVSKSGTVPNSGNRLRNINKEYIKELRSFKALENITVYDNSSGKIIPFGIIEKGKSYEISGDYGQWWRIVFLDRIGYIRKDQVKVEFGPTDKYFRAIQNSVVYNNRSGKLEKIGEIVKGQTYKIVNDFGNWWEVQFGKGFGYVYKAHTSFATKNEINIINNDFQNSKDEIFTLKNSKVYDNSSGKLVVIGEIEEDQFYPIVSEYGENWWKINYLGRVGYIFKNGVHKMEKPYIEEVIKEYKDKNTSESMDKIGRFFISVSSNYLKNADNMLENKFTILDYGTFDFENEIPWNERPEIIENTSSYFRALHAHFFLNDLIFAYKQTNEKKYIIKGYEIIEDWIQKNPYGKAKNRFAWHDEGTARRLVTWINFFDSAREILDEDQQRLILNSMEEHVKLLISDSFHTSYTNHGMFQDEALLVYSTYFEQNSVVYKKLAKKRLKEYFEFIISYEGVHLEHSPSYHQVIANSIRKYKDFFEHKGDVQSSEYYSSLYNKMADYATWVIKPDGTLPLIGDTFVTDQPYIYLWEDNQNYIYARTKGSKGSKPVEHSKVFPKAGYAIFRDDWSNGVDSTYIHFTAAYHTDYHKHSDDLSVWIYAKGHDIVTESGPNGHQYDLPLTQYAYSSFAHNTLIVNNEGLPRVDGKFSETYIEDYFLGDSISSVTGVNKRFNNVTHIRNLQYDREEKIITIIDEISSQNDNNYKLLWNLAEGVTAEQIDKNYYRLLINDEEVMTLQIKSNNPVNTMIVKGNKDPYIGWHIKDSNNPIPTETIILEIDSKDTNIKSIFTIK